MADETSSSGKRIFTYVILPALIAGLFAFLPTLYQEWKQPRASLTVESTVGPHVNTTDGSLRIGTVSISNTGTKTLTDVRVYVDASAATLQAFNLADAALTFARATSKGGAASIEADTLLPGERISASYLINSTSSAVAPARVRARSSEVIGSPPVVKKSEPKFASGVMSAISATSAVLLTIAMWMFGLRRSRMTIRSSPSDKQSYIRYVAMRAGVNSFDAHPEVAASELTYIRASDILFGIAQSSPSLKHQCLLACQGLLIAEMAEDSRQLIVRNIERLQSRGSFQTEGQMLRTKSVSVEKTIEIRQLADELIDNPALFFLSEVLKRPAASLATG